MKGAMTAQTRCIGEHNVNKLNMTNYVKYIWFIFFLCLVMIMHHEVPLF